MYCLPWLPWMNHEPFPNTGRMKKILLNTFHFKSAENPGIENAHEILSPDHENTILNIGQVQSYNQSYLDNIYR